MSEKEKEGKGSGSSTPLFSLRRFKSHSRIEKSKEGSNTNAGSSSTPDESQQQQQQAKGENLIPTSTSASSLTSTTTTTIEHNGVVVKSAEERISVLELEMSRLQSELEEERRARKELETRFEELKQSFEQQRNGSHLERRKRDKKEKKEKHQKKSSSSSTSSSSSSKETVQRRSLTLDLAMARDEGDGSGGESAALKSQRFAKAKRSLSRLTRRHTKDRDSATRSHSSFDEVFLLLNNIFHPFLTHWKQEDDEYWSTETDNSYADSGEAFEDSQEDVSAVCRHQILNM